MKIEALLGFGQVSGRIVSGDTAVAHRLRRGRVRLVLVARDAGRRVIHRYGRLCAEQGVPLRQWGTKAELGHILGQRPRSVVGVLDDDFARRLLDALPAEG